MQLDQLKVLSGAVGAVQSEEAALAVAPAIHVMLEEEGVDYRPVARSVMRKVAAPSFLNAMKPRTLADLR